MTAAETLAPVLNDLGSVGAGTSTPDLSKGLYVRITCTASTRTIANPIVGTHRDTNYPFADVADPITSAAVGLVVGTVVFVEVKNTSGGALTVTWGNAYKGAPTNPATANRRVHIFVYDGANLVLANQAADIAN
jgi:hypothetical protein